MRKLVTTVAFLGILTATASAQSGAAITMPPNASQSGLFPFANQCLTAQTFKISAVPPADWLRVEPATVGVGPNSSFAVRVTVNTSGTRDPGKYRSGLTVVCTSCAATEPPCLLDAREFPIALTIGDVGTPGDFELTAVPVPAIAAESSLPRPILEPDPPPGPRKRLLLLVALGLLATGAMGGVVALRGLFAGRISPEAVGEMRARSERHEARR